MSMTIENIGQFIRSGEPGAIMDQAHTKIERPQAPSVGDAGHGAASGSQVGPERTFAQLLDESLQQVNQTQLEADRAIKELTAGRNKNIHETMLAIEKADMTFRLAMQVRNKMIEAYREVMRMQV